MSKRLWTSESVTEGHPDKICDQISDSVLDAILALDPMARVACETAVSTGMVVVIGEVSTNCYVDIQKIVRKTICDIGYDNGELGFDGNTCAVLVALDEQSKDIASGVDNSLEVRQSNDVDEYAKIGAGDQGLMFGYACDETEELMPMSISLAHKLAKKLTDVRKNKTLKYLRPDGKTQVTVEYDGEKPKRIDTVVISSQHEEGVSLEKITKDITEKVITPTIPKELLDKDTRILINPSGKFVIGGPNGDSGLTGRKIIVDTYGGIARHGGGAFSGKDATKVDRSACYMARYVAKNIVASKLASKCEIQISYAIGMAKPVSVRVDTFGTGKINDQEIENIIDKVFDLRPAAIIETLELRNPIYKQTAAYGHFGRNDLDLPWERTDKIQNIIELANHK